MLNRPNISGAVQETALLLTLSNTNSSSKLFPQIVQTISRSEQTPRSGFNPRKESDHSVCDFLPPSWFDKKVDSERYDSNGSYELLVSNADHQINEKLIILK